MCTIVSFSMFLDVRLSHVNEDYLLTYLLTNKRSKHNFTGGLAGVMRHGPLVLIQKSMNDGTSGTSAVCHLRRRFIGSNYVQCESSRSVQISMPTI